MDDLYYFVETRLKDLFEKVWLEELKWTVDIMFYFMDLLL